MSNPLQMSQRKGKEVLSWKTSKENDGEVAPPSDLPFRREPHSVIQIDKRKENKNSNGAEKNSTASSVTRGKPILFGPWETSNQNDRAVTLPSTFLPSEDPDSLAELLRREKEMWRNQKGTVISLSFLKGKTKFAVCESSNKNGQKASSPSSFLPWREPCSVTNMDKRKEKELGNEEIRNGISLSGEENESALPKLQTNMVGRSSRSSFLPYRKPESVIQIDKEKGKEISSGGRQDTISHSIVGEKSTFATWENSDTNGQELTLSLGLPSFRKPGLMIENREKKETFPFPLPAIPGVEPGTVNLGGKGEKALIVFFPEKREEHKEAIGLERSISSSSSSNKVTSNEASGSSAGINSKELDQLFNVVATVAPEPQAASISLNPRLDLTFARQRLSLLLPLTFPVLFDPAKSKELLDLATMLQEDYNLKAYEVPMLKLIKEIPFLREQILDITQAVRQVNGFFFNLEANFSKVASLWKGHKRSQEKLEALQAEIRLDVAALRGFEGQNKNLSARYAILVCSLKMKNKLMADLKASLREIGNKMDVVFNDIRVANARRDDWEDKKILLADRCRRIKAKFEPLFTLEFKPFESFFT